MIKRSKIANSFSQHFVDVVIGYLSSQDQWDLLRTTILTILQHDCYEEGMIKVDRRVRK